jgi:hypothetical protein
MIETCETVVIETDSGPVRINKSDLTEDHKLPNSKPVPEKSSIEIPGKIADIRAALDDRNIEYDGSMGKAELRVMLETAILAESE